MGYTYLSKNVGVKKVRSSLTKAVTAFIRDDCAELRFSEKMTEREEKTGQYFGTSAKPGQIPYNMEKDIDRLCLERSLAHFLESGRKADAYDIYMCFIDMFLNDANYSLKLIEMLSEYEENGSVLLMKHRDHFTHSVYVFSMGLAIYHNNATFRNVYRKAYVPDADEHSAAHHFLRQWGLTALFHDTGYPFEIPFEQIESFFEVFGSKRKGNPFMRYDGLEKLTRLSPKLKEKANALYNGERSFSGFEELFAAEICRKLGGTYGLEETELRNYISKKPTHPEDYSYYMDHGWFSALNVFFLLFDRMDLPLTQADMDAMTAIMLHNSLYKFGIADYKNPGNKPLKMEKHPLAWLLFLCDELQCWDRAAYGRNTRSELHPMDCVFEVDEKGIHATYTFDQNERYKEYLYKLELQQWLTLKKHQTDDTDLPKKPKIKALSEMLRITTKDSPKQAEPSVEFVDNPKVKSAFEEDIASIVDLGKVKLQADIKWEARNNSRKRSYLSSGSFLHLYNFAVALNGRYMNITAWQAAEAAEREAEFLNEGEARFKEAFDALSLEYKLSNIGTAKEFDFYLHAIGCFYTDRPVDAPMVDRFTQKDLKVIGPLEHERWLNEHLEMGWEFGDASGAEREQKRIHKCMIPRDKLTRGMITHEAAKAHQKSLPKEYQNLDTEPMNLLLVLMRVYDGVRVYRIPEIPKNLL